MKHLFSVMVSAIVLSVLNLAGSGWAADCYWNVGNGNFTNTSSWAGGVAPTGADNAYITNSGNKTITWTSDTITSNIFHQTLVVASPVLSFTNHVIAIKDSLVLSPIAGNIFFDTYGWGGKIVITNASGTGRLAFTGGANSVTYRPYGGGDLLVDKLDLSAMTAAAGHFYVYNNTVTVLHDSTLNQIDVGMTTGSQIPPVLNLLGGVHTLTNLVIAGTTSGQVGSNGTWVVSGSGTVLSNNTASAWSVDLIGNNARFVVTNNAIYYGNLSIGKNASPGASGDSALVADGGTINYGTVAIGASGNSVSNSLTVDNGGHLAGTGVTLGNVAAASNSLLLVTGPSATLTNSGSLIVSQGAGQGNQVIVSNGAALVTYKLGIGYGAGSINNTVVVAGPGSVLLATNTMTIGENGTSVGSQLIITNGGYVAAAGINPASGYTGTDMGVRISDGGVLEMRASGGTFTFRGGAGDTFSNTGGTYQFTDGTYSFIMGVSTITLTDGVISYRSMTNANVWGSMGGSRGGVSYLSSFQYSGNNTFRMNNSSNTISVTGGDQSYTFQTGVSSNFARLELVNGNTMFRNGSITIGATGSMLISNTTAVIVNVLTNNSAAMTLVGPAAITASNGVVWLTGSAATTTAGLVTFDAYTTNRLNSGTVTWCQLGGATQAVNGVVAGSGGLVKNGAGVLILAASNTYSGATAVSNGTLTVNGSINSAVTIAAGGALSGAGTVYGAVGNSGTNTVTITDGNGGCTCLKVSGTLNITGATLNVADPGSYLASSSASYTLMTFTPGGLTGTFAANNLPVGWLVHYYNSLGTITLSRGYPGTLIKIE